MSKVKKTIIRGTEETLTPMLSGARKAFEIITDTMGPGGGCVVSKRGITKDGATVASSLEEVCEGIEQMGVNLVCNASEAMGKEVGDGTTTVTAVLYGFLEEGLKLIRMGYAKHEIIEALNIIEENSRKIIESKAEKISSDSKKMAEIATIASNGDRKTGELLAELFKKLGQDGVIQVEEARGTESEIAVRPGFFFNNGPASQEFFKKTGDKRQKISIEKAKVLVLNYKADNIGGNLLKLLNLFLQNREHLIIVADDYSNDFLNIIIRNVIPDLLRCVCIKAISFGDRKKAFLEDVAVVTGATVVNSEEELSADKLGTCEKVLITKDNTTLYGKGNGIQKRIDEIQHLLEEADSSYEKDYLKERLARINQGIGVFFAAPMFGKGNEIALKEYKERVDDAIHACFNALKFGILPGGGVDFLIVKEEIIKIVSKYDSKISTAVASLLKAFENPIKIIIANTQKKDVSIAIYEIISSGYKKIFDAVSGEIVDIKKTGIINPARVVEKAIQIACSRTSQFINCKSAIVEIEEKDEVNNSFPTM